MCSNNCGIEVRVENDRIVAVRRRFNSGESDCAAGKVGMMNS
jgi:hypothetical protein